MKQRAGTAKDAELVDQAFGVGLIDGPERIELNAIRALRNQYGHPTSASPNREMAAHALRTAVTAVLAKPPLIMHGGAKDLARRAATDRHLIPADAAAIDGFVASRASVIHSSARPIFIRELLAGATGQLNDPNGEMLVDRCIRMTTRALALWSVPLTTPDWNVDEMQLSWPAVSADALCHPDVWPFIEAEDRDRLLSRCLDPATAASFSRTPGRLLARADALWVSNQLTESQVERVRAAMVAADPRRLLGTDVRYEHVARAIVRRLVDGSFKVAGEGVELLRSTDDALLAALDESLQFEVGCALAYAADQNTFAAINEIESMPDYLDRWPIPLRRGVVVGGAHREVDATSPRGDVQGGVAAGARGRQRGPSAGRARRTDAGQARVPGIAISDRVTPGDLGFRACHGGGREAYGLRRPCRRGCALASLMN